MKGFSFADFELDTLTVYQSALTLQADGGFADPGGDRVIKTENWACAIQEAQNPNDDKTQEFGLLNLVDTFLAIGMTSPGDIQVGDWAVDDDGTEYEIMGADQPGGINPVGDVFVVVLKIRGDGNVGGS